MPTILVPIVKKSSIVFLLILVGISSILYIPVSAQDNQNPSTAEAIANAVAPERDLNELAERLKGVQDIPPVPSSPVRDYQLGDTDQFWVHNDDEVYQVDATLVYMNDVLYMWVQDGYQMDQSRIELAADRFAEEIYQPVRDVFGSEWSPGIDGNPRLHILHSADLGSGIAGYFYGESEYSQLAAPASNEREMFFVAVDMLDYGVDYYLSILAHEFQHMIHWAVDGNEESWLNEGLAELSAYIAGFGVSGFSPNYLDDTDINLTHWPELDSLPIYGGGFLFTAYMLEQYGIDAIRSLVAHPQNGMESVNDVLLSLEIADPFSDDALTAETLFTEWVLTNYLNDNSLLDGRYGYQNIELQMLGTADITSRNSGLPVSFSDYSISQWAAQYHVIEISPAEQTVNYHFDGATTIQLLPVDAHSGDYAYWSNRVDGSDTRLTRAFDLSEVETATLNFWSWFDIEQGWDFAYVMLSADGGETWQILQTPYTIDENPHGTSYGSAFSGSTGKWVEQTLDLSAYAGQNILLRFEYITDDATIKNGFLLDDLSIPEIAYSTDFETADDTWLAEGWARVDNILEQRFALHVIEQYADGNVAVQRLWLGDNAQNITGQLTLAENVEELVFVVSAFAPSTVQTARYSLEIDTN